MKINSNVKFWFKRQSKGYVVRHTDLSCMTRFDMGECDFVPTKQLSDLIKQANIKSLSAYPDPNYSHLKKALARNQNISPAMITVSAGSDELIETLPRLFINSGDRVVLAVPTFYRMIESSIRNRATVFMVKTRLENNFQFDSRTCQEIIKKSRDHRTKIIWLCSPNNPTGQVIDPVFIQQIAINTTALVVIDEAFTGFLNPLISNKNIQLVKKFPNIFLIRSLSKAHGLAGLRIGWGVGNKKIIKLLEKWRLPFNISSLTQVIAINTLTQQNIHQIRILTNKERFFLVKKISHLQNIEIVPGSQTNIMLMRHRKKDLFKELSQRGILTADFRRSCGLEGLGFIRITVRKKSKNVVLIKALERIN